MRVTQAFEEALKRELLDYRAKSTASIKGLELQLEEQKEKCIFLASELKSKDHALLNAMEANRAMSDKAKQFESDLHTAIDKLASEQEASKRQSLLFNNENEKLAAALKEQQAANRQLTGAIADAECKFKDTVKTKDQEISRLRSELDKEVLERTHAVSILEAKLHEKTKEVGLLDESNRELSKQLKDLVAQSDNKDKQAIASLMAEKESLKNEMNRELSMLKSQLSDSSAQLNQEKNSSRDHQAKLTAAMDVVEKQR
jgi:hypothetical protein